MSSIWSVTTCVRWENIRPSLAYCSLLYTGPYLKLFFLIIYTFIDSKRAWKCFLFFIIPFNYASRKFLPFEGMKLHSKANTASCDNSEAGYLKLILYFMQILAPILPTTWFWTQELTLITFIIKYRSLLRPRFVRWLR